MKLSKKHFRLPDISRKNMCGLADWIVTNSGRITDEYNQRGFIKPAEEILKSLYEALPQKEVNHETKNEGAK